jgi:hypothetical protein
MPKDRERYFQTIARHLFSLRGAPFVLSAREMEVVEAWEADGIPLGTVLEGMDRGYEDFRIRKGRTGRKLTLTRCHPHVMKAFALLRDRGVGQERRAKTQDDKCREIRKAVEAFMEDIPSQVSELREIFASVLKNLASGKCDSESLEELDTGIETLLFGMASRHDHVRLSTEIAQEYDLADREEMSRLVRIKWVKSMRERYRVPHVSPFYY